jgi:hypothetical protein
MVLFVEPRCELKSIALLVFSQLDKPKKEKK